MDARLVKLESRTDVLERNPLIWFGHNLPPLVVTVVTAVLGGVGLFWLKAKLGL